MANSDRLYKKMYFFQQERQELATEYEKEKARLERYRGSKGYGEEIATVDKEYKDKLRILQEKARQDVDAILRDMRSMLENKTMPAPTEEQLRLITLLKMRAQPTEDEVESIAKAVSDNPLAVAIVHEYAHEKGFITSFAKYYRQLPSAEANKIIRSARKSIEDFIRYDTSRSMRIAAEIHKDLYGTTGDEKPLPKRKKFASKDEFYHEVLRLGTRELELFSDAVDGQDAE